MYLLMDVWFTQTFIMLVFHKYALLFIIQCICIITCSLKEWIIIIYSHAFHRSWSFSELLRRRSSVRRLRRRGTCARRSSACVPKVRGRWERPTSHAYGWRESWSRPDSYECVTRAVRLAVCEPSTPHRLVQSHTLFLKQTFKNLS